MTAPLDGWKVVDLTQMLSGPFATLLLAGLGADVVKVERPDGGDPVRQNAPYLGSDGLSLTRRGDADWSIPFLNRNRSKRSVVADLTTREGRDVLAGLVSGADLVVENFRAGTADRLGVGYKFARAVNPRIVYCSISGFGASADGTKAMDLIIQALSGLMFTSGREGEDPVRVGVPVADLIAPLFAVIGCLAAVPRARATGHGEHVDVSMLGSLTSLLAAEDVDVMEQLGLPARTGNSLRRLAPFGVYAAADGHVAICAPSDAFMTGIAEAMQSPGLLADPRFATRDARVTHSDELDELIGAWTGKRGVPEVIAELEQRGVPVAEVRRPAAALRDDRVRTRHEVVRIAEGIAPDTDVLGSGVPISFSRSRLPDWRPAPRLGADTDTVSWRAEMLPPATNLHDLATLAEQQLPLAVWDSIAGGAHDEQTVLDNHAAYGRWRIVPRHFEDVRDVDTATTVLGREVALPVLLAPVGTHQLVHPDGELATARAAAAAGTVLCVATGATRSLEEVAATGPGRRWFQLYHVGREQSARFVGRAEAAGYEAVVVTIDVPLPYASKERNLRHGYDPLLSQRQANFDLPDAGTRPPFVPVTWADLGWLRSITELPLLVKGVLDAGEAARCVDLGADGVIVSNHGGRMLDAVLASLDALPDVVDRVGDRCDVLVDGGVRRGTDVLTALALGARAVLIGRPFLHGLAVGGDSGVAAALEALRRELSHALAFSGCHSPADVSPRLVRPLPATNGRSR